ncbi:aspartate ammonia-lyase [Peptococcaceae bacterium]|nr:aspartate ammonia-lyase [Peptococcaceae bacterium]MCL0100803.1 aspartate ammonia-lyase [Peptococcaceae bacterium]
MARVERDLLGTLEIPDDAYYGIHTLRAFYNFNVSGRRVHPELIKAIAVIKQAAADANMTIGRLDRKIGDAIYQAASEVAQGEFLDQFIVDAMQGGAGTSTNMNVNEVIANRAIEILGGKKGDYALVHPIDHVNMGQSTNDVYPTAIRIAAIRLLKRLSESCAVLQGALQKKEALFSGILKVGRTQMQDALPIILGQEFGAYAEAVSRDRWRLYKVEERLRQVNLGGTAIGTSVNTERRYIYLVIERLRSLTGLGLARAENMVDVTQNADVFVEVSGLIKAAAVTLIKISSDLRLLSSGPRAGISEIRLPDLQAGSSIMPGKVNPVMPEMVTQVSYQAISNDFAISMAAQSGQLELNAFLPLIADNLLSSIEMLSSAMKLFSERCIEGIEANEKRCAELLENSVSWVTVLVPKIGYERASELAKKALEKGISLKQAILEEKIMEEKEIDGLLSNPDKMLKASVIDK